MALNYQSLLNGETLFGSAPAGGVMGGETQVANKDAMMALASQLLSGSGYSDRRSTFGQQAGLGLQAASAARAQSLQQQQKQRLIDAQIGALMAKPTGGKLQQDFEYAKSQGYMGSIEDFKRISGATAQAQPTAPLQEYDRYVSQETAAGRTPLEYIPFLEARAKATAQPANPTVQVVNGVPTVVQPSRAGGAPTTNPLSTQQSEIDAARARAEAEARAKARGAVVGEAEGGIEKKANAAENINAILDVADPLIDLSTGSALGAGADKVAAMFGKSLDGAQAAAQLQILQAGLMFAQPRMEGPQSVFDVQLYERAAGQIGDPTVPAATKKAAVKTIRALQAKYKAAAGGPRDVPSFATEAEAEAAGIKPGTRVVIGGISGTWQ